MMMGAPGTPARYFYIYDGSGSVIALSNTNGQIAEQYRYDAFGNTKVYDASGGLKFPYQLICNPYMFTGRRLDPETFAATPDSMGLYYYRARMYNPQLGRFMQPDPIGYYDAMNLYQYCGNNPVNWIDPWGSIKTSDLPPGAREELKDILNRSRNYQNGLRMPYGIYMNDCDNQNGKLKRELDSQNYRYWNINTTWGAKDAEGWSDGDHTVLEVSPTSDLINEMDGAYEEKGKPRQATREGHEMIIDVFHHPGNDLLRLFGVPYPVEFMSEETFLKTHPSQGRNSEQKIADRFKYLNAPMPEGHYWSPTSNMPMAR